MASKTGSDQAPVRKSKLGVLFVSAVVALVLAVACLPRNLKGPDACDENGALLHDDFEGEQDCGWALYERSGALAEIADGVMRLSTSQPGQIWWTNPGRNFDDAIITVQARQSSGPDDNAYGVICRYQSTENFYLFLISGDGHYAIGKYQSGIAQVEYLSGDGQFQFSDVINQGAAANELRVGCVGNELSLAINGIPVETVTDPTFVTGDIGLGASTFEPGTAVIDFDDVRVIAP